MKTGVSISRRDHAWYVRVTFVTLVALLPLALLAQGSGQSAQPTRTPAAQSGANWADEIIIKKAMPRRRLSWRQR